MNGKSQMSLGRPLDDEILHNVAVKLLFCI